MRRPAHRQLLTHRAPIALVVTALLMAPIGIALVPATPATAAVNEITAENSLPGSPASEWDIEGAGDESIQGYATQISVNQGETINFKIDTDASDFRVDLYRLGWYQGNGARKVATIDTAATTETQQPNCALIDGTTDDNLVDCGNWSVSASWAVPADSASGVYIAKPTRADDGGASHIVFVVRDDDGNSDLLVQTADTTWQSYNPYGGYNAYGSTSTGVNAQKLSYNRPFTTRGGELENFLFNAEYPMIRWLERNGYDVSYSTHRDTGERPAELLEHEAFLSVGHDEYWSQEQRDAVEAARDAGVDLAFFSGNEIYWKIRQEDSSQDSVANDRRTQVVYKEGSAAPSGPAEHRRCYANFSCDPSAIWTGLWRESQSSSVENPVAGEPENAVSGQISWRSNTASMEVPGAYARMRFWRNTDVANLSPSGRVTLPHGTIGYEWNPEQPQYADWYPAGRVLLSETTIVSYAGTEKHHMSLYRAPSGALVFGAGTVQWSWGLDGVHDHGAFMDDPGDTEDRNVQQATLNLLADMGAQPGTMQAELVAATPSTDTTPPTVAITSTAGGVTGPGARTVTGTAADVGGVVGTVEVSVDGGSTWRRASGRESWSYSFQAPSGTPAVRVRAADDSANLSPEVTLGATQQACGETSACTSIFARSVTGAHQADPSAVELGVKFRSDVPGEIAGIRFFKTGGNTGAHTGTLWNSAGYRLATVTFSQESASGWQEAAFSTPVAIEAGATYVASYHTASGYATGSSFANAGVDTPPLHALRNGVDGPNGVYMYGSGGVYPSDSWGSSNYLVDVLFTPAAPDGATTVTATAPAANATGVDPAADVSVTFSAAIDPASVNPDTLELRDPAGARVPAAVAYDAGATRAVLNPDARLAEGTRYTATIKGADAGVLDVNGNPLASDVSWTFTTRGENTTAPAVSATTPTADATDATLVANVTIAFTEAVDPGTVSGATIELRTEAGSIVPAAVTYDAASVTAVIDPTSPLAARTRHTVTVKSGVTGVRDLTGLPLAEDYRWSFTTGDPDTTPPVVSSIWPVRDANDFGVDADVTAVFSEPMTAGSISGTTVRLRDASGSLVNAVVSYDAGTKAAVINPSAPLAYDTEYTATIAGGSSGVKDLAGNPMAAAYSWTFATMPRASERRNPNVGPGGPLLIVKGTGAFGAYLPEMIRGEGLNLFTVRTTSTFTAADLAPYKTLVLGETSLTAAHVAALTDWVTAGGNLIAMRPSTALAGLFGLDVAGGTLAEGYLRVDGSTAPGEGIVTETMQFHGTADLYRLRDAQTQVVATLYSNGTTATTAPAVTLRNVGSAGGSATAFAFDLARSVVQTRQGNPAWAGQERDGVSPIRTDELFFTDFVDLSKVAIPQADEQQRLLANIITQTMRDVLPVPRFWYLPRGEVAAVVMTADEHNGGNVPERFAQERSQSRSGCYVSDWECLRSTSYQFVDYPLINDAQARDFEQQGFEIALHPSSGCRTPTRAQFAAQLNEQLAALGKHYPSIAAPQTSRNDCVFWIDYTTVPEEEERAGIHLDANYYYWPSSWAATKPGMFTGSGMAQRFLASDGTLVDVYQATTQMTDESGQGYPSTAIALLDGAINKGYYGAFTANLHTDGADAGRHHDAVINAAEDRGVPVITAKQLLDWTDGRNASSFTNLTRDQGKLTYTITADTHANGLQAMLPMLGTTGTLQSISRGGTDVAFKTKTVKGVSYAVFSAASGGYTATYGSDTKAPQISEAAATVTGGTTADIAWTTNEPADTVLEIGTSADALTTTVRQQGMSTAHQVPLTGLSSNTTYYYRVSSTDAYGNIARWPATGLAPASFTTPSAAVSDTTVADFSAGTVGTSTYVTGSAGGEVVLAPLLATEFEGSSAPAGWSTGSWTGGNPSFSGGAASVDGSWLRANGLVGSGRAIEFSGTFSGAPYQNAGFGVTANAAGESWAMFGTAGTTGVLYARTLNGGGGASDVSLGSQYVGSEHVFRIEWDTQVRFFIDGNLVHTAATVGGTMRPLATDYLNGGGVLKLNWMRLTPYAASGSFHSRIHDGGAIANWGNLSYTADVPSGSTLALDVRTGNTSTPDSSWTAFTAVAQGKDMPGSSRYLQYRARFTTGDRDVTPILNSVTLQYSLTPPTPDTTAPVISALNAVATGQTTATISWTTDEHATSRVVYGTSASALNLSAPSPTPGTAHTVQLTGLAPETVYHFRVESTDAAGNTATFPSGGSPSTVTTQAPDRTAPTIAGRAPSPDSTNATVNTDVTVTFDEAIAAASVTTSSLTLRQEGAGTDVPAAVSVAGAVATLNPNSNLAPSTRYTVTVAGSVTDAAGNPLGAPATWSFTTGAAVATVLEDTSMAQFSGGTPGSSTYVARTADGEVVLAPLVASEFEGSGMPSGWSSGSWTGGTPTFSGGTASVDGSWLRANQTVGAGRAVEFSTTFSGASYQNAGFAVTANGAGESWAMFGTNGTSGVLQARIRDAGGAAADVPLGSQYLGSEHVFRIEWDATVRFYVDGTLVHTAATVTGSMRPLATDYSTGGSSLELNWMRLTSSVPTVDAEFDDADLPDDWRSTLWNGGTGGSAVGGGRVVVNGGLLRADGLAGPGSTLEFTGTFGASANQHAGFAIDFSNTPRWAIFSTGGSTNTLYARTGNNGSYVDTPLGAGLVGSSHTYRIDWQADRIVFSVDGSVVHTQNVTITGTMGPAVSDYAAGGPGVTIDRMRMTPSARSGVFTSRVLDARATADWQTLEVTAGIPAGTGLLVEVRTGNTPTPDGSWTGFTAVASGGDIPGGSRYAQYRATFTSTTNASPILERIGIGALVP